MYQSLLSLGTVMLVTALASAGENARQYQVGPLDITVAADAQDPPALPVRPGPTWIGVGCHPVSETLRAQLNLPEGQGLVVMNIAPDSPAQKAGIHENDVLLQANGKPLGHIQDLVAAVDAAQKGKLKLEVLRQGKPMKVEVQPEPRPEGMIAQPLPAAPDEGDWRAMRRWFEHGAPGNMRLHMFGPGAILPPGPATPPAPLPDNLSVTITRKGKEPAKIIVQREGQRWEVTEKELDKLPADIRPYVERQLNPQAGAVGRPEMPPQPGAQGEFRGRVERRLDELNRRLDQMRKEMEQYRQPSGQEKTPPAAPGRI